MSDWCGVKFDVPRGSIPAPILFNLYVSDLGRDLKKTVIIRDTLMISSYTLPNRFLHWIDCYVQYKRTYIRCYGGHETMDLLSIRVKLRQSLLDHPPFHLLRKLQHHQLLVLTVHAFPFLIVSMTSGYILIVLLCGGSRSFRYICRKTFRTLHQLNRNKSALPTSS